MKKLGVFLLIVGLLVAVAGYFFQDTVEDRKEIKDLSAILRMIDKEELSPELAQEILDGKYDIGPITVEGTIRSIMPDEADKIMLGMQAYALTPKVIAGGLIAAGVGLLLAIFAPSKKKRARSGYTYGA